MFRLFKKKSKTEVMEKKYQQLLKEAHKLSTINRRASDQKMVEANNLLKELEIENAV